MFQSRFPWLLVLVLVLVAALTIVELPRGSMPAQAHGDGTPGCVPGVGSMLILRATFPPSPPPPPSRALYSTPTTTTTAEATTPTATVVMATVVMATVVMATVVMATVVMATVVMATVVGAAVAGHRPPPPVPTRSPIIGSTFRRDRRRVGRRSAGAPTPRPAGCRGRGRHRLDQPRRPEG